MTRFFFCIRWTASMALLIPILWLPPMGLNNDLQGYSRSISQPLDPERPEAKLLIEEHKKATDEIAARITFGNDWFKWKFLVVGSIFLGAFTFIGLRTDMFNRSSTQTADDFLKQLLSSNYLCNLLALAVVLSITIDIHERHNVIITNQIGLWITYIVEPAFYGKPLPVPNPFDNLLVPNPFDNLLGWEQFIRQGLAIHTDPYSSLTTWTLLHLLTIILYGAYLLVLSQVSKTRERNSYWFTGVSFVFVHLAIMAFAFAGHSIPGNVHFIVFSYTFGAFEVTMVAVILTTVLAFLNYPEFLRVLARIRN